jgi:hypothetical protein
MIEKCKSLNIDVIPLFQPPNSPDLNILDLSFFNSLQSRQFRGTLGNCSATLVDTVIDTFLEYPWEVLDWAFLTLQSVMNEILKCDGNNNFKLPHLNKSKLIRENDDGNDDGNGNGSVPTTIKAVNYLEAMGWSLDEGDNAINEPTTNGEKKRKIS